jgi:hypothetical protein
MLTPVNQLHGPNLNILPYTLKSIPLTQWQREVARAPH